MRKKTNDCGPHLESRQDRTRSLGWNSLGVISLLLSSLVPSVRAELPTHDIAAASLVVVQSSVTDSNAITVTAESSVNDFRVRTGSNGGDFNVQIGDDPLDDAANGVLMSSVAEHQRNHGLGSFSAVSMTADNANGYFIPISSAAGLGAGNNPEFNINVAGAWFPYSSWLGAVVKNTSNGGALTVFTGSPTLSLGTHFIDNGGGKSVVDLKSLGIDSRTNGVLLVSGAKNESANFGMVQADVTNGTWNLFIKDVGQATATSFEQDGIAFVFIPKTNTSVVSGRFLGDASIDMFSGNSPQFTVTELGVGRYELKIPGRFPTNGVLIISPEGGGAINMDNFATYQANAAGDGWEIQTRDTPGAALESPGPTEGVVSFVYIPVPTPGITANPANNLVTTENGGTADFTVRLDTAPTADVTIAVSSSNPNEGVPSTSSLVFTTTDWNVPQPVTITGQDDLVADGTAAYSIFLTPTSADPIYHGLSPVNVSVINADNEAGVTITPISGLITAENGATATFSVRLNSAPTANVTIGFTSSNTGEGTVSPESLVFNNDDWDQEKIVTVTGVDDPADDGSINYTIISAPATSSDSAYNGFNPADVAVSNEDDDTANILVTPLNGLTVTESGATANYTVVLQTQPAANVVVNIVSSDASEASVTPSLTFTPSDWNTPKPVTITGVDDLEHDGSIALTITNSFSSADSVYAAFAPVEVSVTTLDNEATITLSKVDTYWGIGMPAVGVDGRASINDPYSTSYNGGTLTLTLTANGSADDRLEIRNTGNSAGQIGVSGNVVSYGGVAIATFSGGSGTTPLVVTFNGASTPVAAEALLRAVTFRNVNSNPSLASRTISVAFVDGDGGVSMTVNKTIHVGLLRQSQFQEGADWGYGSYTGAVDVQLHQPDPGTVYPIGHNTNSGLWVNWPDAATPNASQVLLRFDNIFGNNPGQVPTNAVIVATELVLDINDAGDFSPLYRMLVPWDSETATWDSMGEGILPDGSEARSAFDSQIGVVDGSGATGLGSISVSVTPDVIAWANGETNYGWAMPGWFERRDGTGFSPCEAPNISDRPRLRVLWLPAGTQTTSFRQGVNGYAGAFDTRIRMSDPDANFATVDYVFCDAIASGSTNNPDQVLIRFDDIIGSGTGQIPPNAKIHAAILDLASVGNNAMGDGGSFHALLQPWVDASTTWNTWGNGIDTDGIDAAITPTTAAGFAELAPNVQGGYNSFQVTSDVAAWVAGARDNYGWAILPWPGGGDGWGIGLAESATENVRPQLRVYYEPSTDAVIQSLSWTPTSITLQFTGVSGTVYSVQRSGNVAGPYTTIGTATPVSDGTASFTDNSPLPGTGFYRLSNP